MFILIITQKRFKNFGRDRDFDEKKGIIIPKSGRGLSLLCDVYFNNNSETFLKFWAGSGFRRKEGNNNSTMCLGPFAV